MLCIVLASLEVPKFVEKGVVALSLESLDHCVQVFLRLMPLRSHVFVSDFDVDDFLAGLNRLGKVRPDALAYQDQLHQYDMSQVSPANALQRIEVFPVVIGDVVEG